MLQTTGKCQVFSVFLLYLLHQYRIHQESDPIHIYSFCNAPSPLAIPDINIQKLASVSSVTFESPPESYQNQLSSAKMSRASDKYSPFKLSGLPKLWIKVSELTTTCMSTRTSFTLDYMQSTVQRWISFQQSIPLEPIITVWWGTLFLILTQFLSQ
jgi:hypothetical protein